MLILSFSISMPTAGLPGIGASILMLLASMSVSYTHLDVYKRQTILSSIMQMSMLPLTGLSQGTQPIISFNFGAGNYDRVKKAFFLLLKASMIYALFIWLLSVITPNLLVSIFTSDAALKEYSSHVLRIYMASSLLFGVQISCQQTLLALGNAKTSLFLAALRKLILLIPLIFILPAFMAQKDIAVFMAEPVADLLAVITTAALFFRLSLIHI